MRSIHRYKSYIVKFVEGRNTMQFYFIQLLTKYEFKNRPLEK